MSDITDRLDEMIEWFASDSTVTRDSIIDLLEDARNEIADLKAKLAAAEADAAFYRCCALCGEIPKPGSEPSAIDAARGAK